jgi:hypothetical protein
MRISSRSKTTSRLTAMTLAFGIVWASMPILIPSKLLTIREPLMSIVVVPAEILLSLIFVFSFLKLCHMILELLDKIYNN